MPRPLIIKIEDHKLQSNKKATGGISAHLLKEKTSSLYGSYSQDLNGFVTTDNEQTNQNNQADEIETGSLVRNLINRYETSAFVAKPVVLKHKSKSLSDLIQPQFSTERKSRENLTDHYSTSDHGDRGFDFKKMLSKFETDKNRTTANYSKIKQYSARDNNYDSQRINDIKERAKELLDNLSESYYDSALLAKWQDDIVDFLEQLKNMSYGLGEKENYLTEERKFEENFYQVDDNDNALGLKKFHSSNLVESNKSLKVKEARNIFETKTTFEAKVVESKKPLSRSISATYFTGKPSDEDISFNATTYNKQKSLIQYYSSKQNEEGEEYDGADHEDDYEDTPEGIRMVTQPVLASSMKIQELKNLFESNDANKYVSYKQFVSQSNEDEPELITDNTTHLEAKTNQDEERILPPPKILVREESEEEDNNVENSMRQIGKLVEEIEEYDNKIDILTQEDKEEGSYINDVLIKILINLDGVKTYGNGDVQTERRKAIHLVKSCIKKLRGKMRGYE